MSTRSRMTYVATALSLLVGCGGKTSLLTPTEDETGGTSSSSGGAGADGGTSSFGGSSGSGFGGGGNGGDSGFGGGGNGGGGNGGNSGFGGGGSGGGGNGGNSGFGGGGNGGGGNGGNSGFGGGGNGGGPNTPLGQGCREDADCGGVLRCFNEMSSPAGGPAQGYCTVPCSDEAECGAFDARPSCGDLGFGRVCLQGCRPGETPNGGFDPDKCFGRTEVACRTADELPGAPAVCMPVCSTSAHCNSGSCDLASGLCTTSTPSLNIPIGDPCDLSNPSGCVGTCVEVETGIGLCSGLCVIGTTGTVPGVCAPAAPGGGFDGVCLFATEQGDTGTGDLGLCGSGCDCQDECQIPGWICDRTPGIATVIGLEGICIPSDFATDPLPSCAP